MKFLDENDIFNPFLSFQNMGWDFISTLHPYTSMRGFLFNLLQPLHGIANIIKGVLMIALGGIALFTISPILTFFWIRSSEWPLAILLPLGAMATGLASIIRGASQIIATPLTWAIKIPLRLLRTLFTKENDDFYIENRPDAQACLAKGSYGKLHTIFVNGVSRGVGTNLDSELENRYYEPIAYDPTLNHGNGSYGYGSTDDYRKFFQYNSKKKRTTKIDKKLNIDTNQIIFNR